jgi:hypothetical protein
MNRELSSVHDTLIPWPFLFGQSYELLQGSCVICYYAPPHHVRDKVVQWISPLFPDVKSWNFVKQAVACTVAGINKTPMKNYSEIGGDKERTAMKNCFVGENWKFPMKNGLRCRLRETWREINWRWRTVMNVWWLLTPFWQNFPRNSRKRKLQSQWTDKLTQSGPGGEVQIILTLNSHSNELSSCLVSHESKNMKSFTREQTTDIFISVYPHLSSLITVTSDVWYTLEDFTHV